MKDYQKHRRRNLRMDLSCVLCDTLNTVSLLDLARFTLLCFRFNALHENRIDCGINLKLILDAPDFYPPTSLSILDFCSISFVFISA